MACIGINHGRAMLTEDDVRLIRTLHEEGLSYRVIARKFDVGKTTIEHIVTRQTWRHVE
jgi:IS30 family transposase